ncbi:hypothetical protein A3Q56_08723, partial [Intoshia linei]
NKHEKNHIKKSIRQTYKEKNELISFAKNNQNYKQIDLAEKCKISLIISDIFARIP